MSPFASVPRHTTICSWPTFPGLHAGAETQQHPVLVQTDDIGARKRPGQQIGVTESGAGGALEIMLVLQSQLRNQHAHRDGVLVTDAQTETAGARTHGRFAMTERIDGHRLAGQHADARRRHGRH